MLYCQTSSTVQFGQGLSHLFIYLFCFVCEGWEKLIISNSIENSTGWKRYNTRVYMYILHLFLIIPCTGVSILSVISVLWWEPWDQIYSYFWRHRIWSWFWSSSLAWLDMHIISYIIRLPFQLAFILAVWCLFSICISFRCPWYFYFLSQCCTCGSHM